MWVIPKEEVIEFESKNLTYRGVGGDTITRDTKHKIFRNAPVNLQFTDGIDKTTQRVDTSFGWDEDVFHNTVYAIQLWEGEGYSKIYFKSEQERDIAYNRILDKLDGVLV